MSTTKTEKITYLLVVTDAETGEVKKRVRGYNRDDVIGLRDTYIEGRDDQRKRGRAVAPVIYSIKQVTETTQITTETIDEVTSL